MPAESAIVRSWRVGAFTVTLFVPQIAPGEVRCAVCEWEPNLPSRPLTVTEQAEYDAGLLEAIAALERTRQGL